MAGTDDDKTVKQLLDAATRAELERWFGLPSFEQLADRGVAPAPPPEDPELEQLRKRRAAAIAAVDPELLESHRRRTTPPSDLVKFKAEIELRVKPTMGMLDHAMIRVPAAAEPREFELPEHLSDDLRACTPQALLRDLHRSESTFDKVLEWFDPLDMKVDARTIAGEVMATRWRINPPADTPGQLALALIRELVAERKRPWIEIKMPRRRVTE